MAQRGALGDNIMAAFVGIPYITETMGLPFDCQPSGGWQAPRLATSRSDSASTPHPSVCNPPAVQTSNSGRSQRRRRHLNGATRGRDKVSPCPRSARSRELHCLCEGRAARCFRALNLCLTLRCTSATTLTWLYSQSLGLDVGSSDRQSHRAPTSSVLLSSRRYHPTRMAPFVYVLAAALLPACPTAKPSRLVKKHAVR